MHMESQGLHALLMQSGSKALLQHSEEATVCCD